MNILIIDNGTKHLRKLKEQISESDYSVADFSEIDLNEVQKYDAIILSGGHDFPVMGNESRLQKEIEIIRQFQKPVLGICLGFEIIARTFSATLEPLDQKDKGIIEIKILGTDKIFQGIENLKVFESHRWAVRAIPSELIALAKSDHCIEAIRHKFKPIYGVQFHPEMFEGGIVPIS